MEYKLIGSAKQIKWATEILHNSQLTDRQIDTLLRYAGPTMYSKHEMAASIVIDNRDRLAKYADGLAQFLAASPAERHQVALDAVSAVRDLIHKTV